MSIETLVSSQNCIIYKLPHGKPDPNVPFSKDRPRVRQSAQKGSTCWYYLFNMIRTRIGKFPDESTMKARAIEKLVSRYRKNITKFENSFPFSLSFRSSEAKKITPEIAEKLLKENTEKLYAAIPFKVKQEAELRRLLADFSSKKLFENFDKFLTFHIIAKETELAYYFIKSIPKELIPYDHKAQVNELLKAFEETDYLKMMKDQEAMFNITFLNGKSNSLETYAHMLIARLYKLRETTWKPVQGIDAFIEVLKKDGPLSVGGKFGVPYYDNPPKLKAQVNKTHGLYGWDENPTENAFASHEILIVGVTKWVDDKDSTKIDPLNSRVVFLDPSDPSDPTNPSQQRMLTMSWKTFTSIIKDVTSQIGDNNPECYGYHPSWGESMTSYVSRKITQYRSPTQALHIHLDSASYPVTSSSVDAFLQKGADTLILTNTARNPKELCLSPLHVVARNFNKIDNPTEIAATLLNYKRDDFWTNLIRSTTKLSANVIKIIGEYDNRVGVNLINFRSIVPAYKTILDTSIATLYLQTIVEQDKIKNSAMQAQVKADLSVETGDKLNGEDLIKAEKARILKEETGKRKKEQEVVKKIIALFDLMIQKGAKLDEKFTPPAPQNRPDLHPLPPMRLIDFMERTCTASFPEFMLHVFRTAEKCVNNYFPNPYVIAHLEHTVASYPHRIKRLLRIEEIEHNIAQRKLSERIIAQRKNANSENSASLKDAKTKQAYALEELRKANAMPDSLTELEKKFEAANQALDTHNVPLPRPLARVSGSQLAFAAPRPSANQNLRPLQAELIIL